jgi:hypothetical protein
VKYWEIIADNLSKAGFSLGWVSAVERKGRTIWIVDAHREVKRFASKEIPARLVSVASWKDVRSRNCYGSQKSPRYSRVSK